MNFKIVTSLEIPYRARSFMVEAGGNGVSGNMTMELVTHGALRARACKKHDVCPLGSDGIFPITQTYPGNCN